jgi:hypothetical protein
MGMISSDAFAKQINDSLSGPGIIGGDFSNHLSKLMAERMQINFWVSEQPSNLMFKNFKLAFWTFVDEELEQRGLQARESKALASHSLDVPPHVKSYAIRSGIGDRLYEITKAAHSIEAFLREKNLNGKITIDLYSDPEYPEWKNIEIMVSVDEDLQFIYENLKQEIFQLIENSVSEELLDKILITFGTMK